jgi:hypothetical protein
MMKRDAIATKAAVLGRLYRRLQSGKALDEREKRALGDSSREILRAYHDAAASGAESGARTKRLRAAARRALLFLGGDVDRPVASLKDYDHRAYGPFLGVSDEGSAAAAIRDAAYHSPKARVLKEASPLDIGVALDAERLGAIGETAVGPEEYADVWLECVERLLMTTNVSTRLNVRYYKRFPIITLAGGDARAALDAAEEEIGRALSPFKWTPDNRPRRARVFVAFESESAGGKGARAGRAPRMSRAAQVRMLRELKRRVARRDFFEPKLHDVGLCARIGEGPIGRDEAFAAIDLARDAGMRELMLIGKVRKEADEVISLPGLLQYLAPGLLGPVQRRANASKIRICAANVVDAATVASGAWSTLNTARAMGLHLGKYGTFPLMVEECSEMVRDVQQWCSDWSAAPVCFVDQPILSKDRVDADGDIRRGLLRWLGVVRRRGVSVVLIDTIDKSKGWKLLKTGKDDKLGKLGPLQIAGIDRFAQRIGIKVLWAGGITLPQVYEFGKLGVFGIYVTSSAAVSKPVFGIYCRDPLLDKVKEPTFEGVYRTKLLLEAGFLVSSLEGGAAAGSLAAARKLGTPGSLAAAKELEERALTYIQALEGNDKARAAAAQDELAAAAAAGWRRHFRALGIRTRKGN